jgi:hypothetical protein
MNLLEVEHTRFSVNFLYILKSVHVQGFLSGDHTKTIVQCFLLSKYTTLDALFLRFSLLLVGGVGQNLGFYNT